MSVRVPTSIGLLGSSIENPSFHHCAEECQHDVWGQSSFKKLCSIPFYQACCSLHTHTHSFVNKPVHTWKVTVRNVGPSLWLLPFISCKISLSSWLCEIVAAYETFLSRPHEFFRWPIALLPKPLIAQVSWNQSHHTLSSHLSEVGLCISTTYHRCVTATHTYTHNATWLKIPSKPPKLMLFCFFCFVFAPLYSFLYLHSIQSFH